MRRNLIVVLLMLAGLGASAPAGATGALERAFASAQVNDPQYRAARHERDAAGYGVPLARAGLLPSLSLSAGRSSSRGWRDISGAPGGSVRQDLDYRSPVVQLSLRAPLLNFEAIARYRQSKFQLAQAEAQFESNRLQLADRLTTAYFQRLLSDEVVALAVAQLDAAREQLRLAEHRFGGGEGTRVDIADAAASAHLAEAQLLEAQDQAQVAQRGLNNITGEARLPLVVPAEDFSPPPLLPEGLEQWLLAATTNSPALRARQEALEVAALEIQRNRAGHAPRIDLVASASASENESISTLNQETRLYTIGVQLTLPLFSGGGVNAATDQAIALRSRALAERDAELAALQLEIERQYRAVASGAERVVAYANAIDASEVALEGSRRQLSAGLATTADVLNASRQVFLTKRDMAQARYEYLLARLRLQAAAGTDVDEIIADIEQFLGPPG